MCIMTHKSNKGLDSCLVIIWFKTKGLFTLQDTLVPSENQKKWFQLKRHSRNSWFSVKELGFKGITISTYEIYKLIRHQKELLVAKEENKRFFSLLTSEFIKGGFYQWLADRQVHSLSSIYIVLWKELLLKDPVYLLVLHRLQEHPTKNIIKQKKKH